MSSDALPPLPENRVVLGCGSVSVDFLAAVASYPKPDDKIRSTSAKIQGGGNAGNALTCAARLGLKPRLISKVKGYWRSWKLMELIHHLWWKTRTCIHTPGYPPMVPDDLTESNLLAALDGARLVYFDGRLHETALVIAHEANRRGIPILIDAERNREGLDDLLSFSSYAICSAKFPQAWTGAASIPSALVSMLLKLPNLKFVIVTLGEDGCLMLERAANENGQYQGADVDDLLERLKRAKDSTSTEPFCISSGEIKLQAKGIGMLGGRMLLGTAEKIPPSELVDTTGAGDSFIGAVLYALYANMPPETMLSFASQVAAIGCRSLGARTGLPQRTDPRLSPFLI